MALSIGLESSNCPHTLQLFHPTPIKIRINRSGAAPSAIVTARLECDAFATPVTFVVPPGSTTLDVTVTAVKSVVGQVAITLVRVDHCTVVQRHRTHRVTVPPPAVSFRAPSFDGGPFEAGEAIPFNLEYSSGRPQGGCSLRMSSTAFATVDFTTPEGLPPPDTGRDIVATTRRGSPQTVILEAVARATVGAVAMTQVWVGPVISLELVDPLKASYAINERVKIRVKAMHPLRLAGASVVLSSAAFNDTSFAIATGAQEKVVEITLKRPSVKADNVHFKARSFVGCVAADTQRPLTLRVVAPPAVNFHHDSPVQPKRASHVSGEVVTITVSLSTPAGVGGAEIKVSSECFDPDIHAHPAAQTGVTFTAGTALQTNITIAEGDTARQFRVKLKGTVGQRFPVNLTAVARCTIKSQALTITIGDHPKVQLGGRTKPPIEPAEPSFAGDTITVNLRLAEAAGTAGSTLDLACAAFPDSSGQRSVACRFEPGEIEKAVSVQLDTQVAVGAYPVTLANLVGCTATAPPVSATITLEAAPATDPKVYFATAPSVQVEAGTYRTDGANTATLTVELSAPAASPVRAVITSSAFGGNVYAVAFAKGESTKQQMVRFAFASASRHTVAVGSLSGCVPDTSADVARSNKPKNCTDVLVGGPSTSAVMGCPLTGGTRLVPTVKCNIERLILVEKHGELHNDNAERGEDGVFETSGDPLVLQVIGRRHSDDDFSEVGEKDPHTTTISVQIRSEGDEPYFCPGGDAASVHHPLLTVQEVRRGSRVDITTSTPPGDVSALARGKGDVYKFEVFQAGFDAPDDDERWWRKLAPKTYSLTSMVPFVSLFSRDPAFAPITVSIPSSRCSGAAGSSRRTRDIAMPAC